MSQNSTNSQSQWQFYISTAGSSTDYSPFHIVTTNQSSPSSLYESVPFKSATESAHLITIGVPLINLDIKNVLPFKSKRRMLRPVMRDEP